MCKDDSWFIRHVEPPSACRPSDNLGRYQTRPLLVAKDITTTGWQIACCTAECRLCQPGRLRPQGVKSTYYRSATLLSASSPTSGHAKAVLTAPSNRTIMQQPAPKPQLTSVGPRSDDTVQGGRSLTKSAEARYNSPAPPN